MKVNIGGVWKTVKTAKVNVAGVWRTVTKARVNVAGVWKTGDLFLLPLTATVDDSTPDGQTNGVLAVNTNAVTVTPAGGAAPYTYAWVRTSGVGSANSPTAAVTSFRAIVPNFTTYNGSFQCTVTDAIGGAATVTVNATFTNNGP